MMLASQVASVLQTTTPSCLTHVTGGPSLAMLRSAGLPRRSRQQTRSFRFGLWSSYLDPVFQKELQRRHRVIKHKYAEALNRKLSWDRRSPVYTSRWGLKGLMCSSWTGKDSRPGGRWVNMDELRQMRENLEASISHGIEDVEQNALDQLFGRQESQKVLYNDSVFGWTWATTESKPVDTPKVKMNSNFNTRKRARSGYSNDGNSFEIPAVSTAELQYDIDPITNRKVFRNPTANLNADCGAPDPTSTEIPIKTFKTYRSQFTKFNPPSTINGSNVIHLDDGKTSSATSQFQSSISPTEEELEKYKPYKYNEPDGKFPDSQDTVARGLGDFDHQYKPFKYNEPDGKFPERPNSVSDGLGDFDHPYRPFKYNEPDGKFPEQPSSVPEGLRDFDHEYKPFKYNEPDGKIPERPNPESEGLTDFDHEYKPFKYNEPDGKPPASFDQVEEALYHYDRQSNDWLSQEGFASNASPGRGERKASASTTQRNKIQPPQSRSSYYRLSAFNTADTDKQEDLDLLRASDVRAASGILKKPRVETQAEKDNRRAALDADFNVQQDQNSAASEVSPKRSTNIRQLAEDLELELSYLLNFNAHARGRVERRIAEIEAQLASMNASSARPNKVTGNFVRDFPEEFSATWGTKGSSANDSLLPSNTTDAWGYDKSPRGLELSYQSEMENTIQSAENDYVADVTSQENFSPSTGPTRLETSLQRSLSGSEKEKQSSKDSYTKPPQGLETSFAEEIAKQGDGESPVFITSYGCNGGVNSPADNSRDAKEMASEQSARAQRKKEGREKDKKLVHEIRDIYESTYGAIDCKHRQISGDEGSASTINGNQNADKARTVEGIEQEVREGQYYIQDRYMDIAKVLAQQAPTEGPSDASEKVIDAEVSKSSNKTVSAPEPTLYKILAYDPIMQTINFAETTSIVTDTSSALTPAEVLLRLSNPAKFFPHFQPLQSQGYEIVSGAGDVLVFRKVRDGPPPRTSTSDTASPSPPSATARKINPIDGMQSFTQPATGNFASPTGFVNHDLPSDHPFVSGIDVRREEPVFSGRRTKWRDDESHEEGPKSKSKKAGRGLLIGAAWVAACSYAVGVVAEFFRTGGSDGKGAVGF